MEYPQYKDPHNSASLARCGGFDVIVDYDVSRNWHYTILGIESGKGYKSEEAAREAGFKALCRRLEHQGTQPPDNLPWKSNFWAKP